MTEQEWLECTDPEKMLRFIKGRPTNRLAKKRKVRLFSVACCRRIWPLISHERSRAAVLVAERFADGQATSEELQAAKAEAGAIWLKDALDKAAWACEHVCAKEDQGFRTSVSAIRAVLRHQGGDRGQDGPSEAWLHAIHPAEEAEQCRLLRDIVGNPFRPLPLRKGKRTWEERKRHWLLRNDGTAVKLAQGIYEERAFDRLPILADALEEAGCDAAELLTHLRGPGPHVRGCWALDLLLGKG